MTCFILLLLLSTQLDPVIVNCADTLLATPVTMTRPVYPPLAKRARVEGRVRVRIFINRKGNVTRAVVLSGHPLLNPAALRAARESKFEPADKKVVGVLVYTFRLPEGR